MSTHAFADFLGSLMAANTTTDRRGRHEHIRVYYNTRRAAVYMLSTRIVDHEVNYRPAAD